MTSFSSYGSQHIAVRNIFAALVTKLMVLDVVRDFCARSFARGSAKMSPGVSRAWSNDPQENGRYAGALLPCREGLSDTFTQRVSALMDAVTIV